MANGRTIGQLVLEVQSDVNPALTSLQRLFGIIRDGVSEFARFDTGIREVATLLGRQAVDTGFLQEAQQGAQNLAFEFGTLTSTSIPALYQAISARIPRENAFEFLETANRAAIAGVTDLDTSVRGITAAMNAYGHENLNAADAADALFVGVRFGITTFEQLSNNIGQVTPIAAELGVNFDEVVAAMSAMTAQGVSTAQAATRINAVMFELNRDSTEVSQIFREIAGVSFRDFIQSGGTVQEALNLINEEAVRTDRSMVDMFNRIEAGQGAMLLTGDSARLFEDALEGMASKTGAVDEAVDIMTDGIEFNMNRLFAAIEQVRIQFFEGFEAPVVSLIQNVVPVLEEMLPVFRSLGTVAGEAFGIVGDAVFSVLQNIQGPLLEAFDALGDVFVNAADVISPLVEGLGGLASVALQAAVPALELIGHTFGNIAQILDQMPSALAGIVGALIIFRTQISSAFIGARQSVAAFRADLQTATLQAGRMATAMGVARVAISRFATVLRGVAIFAVIEGLVRLFDLFGESAEQAEERVQRLGDGFAALERETGGALLPQMQLLAEAQQAVTAATQEQAEAFAGTTGAMTGSIGLRAGLGERSRELAAAEADYNRVLRDTARELNFTDEQMQAFVGSTDEVADKLSELEEEARLAQRELIQLALAGDVNVNEFNDLVEVLGLTEDELESLATIGGPQFTQTLEDIRAATELGLNSTAELLEQYEELGPALGRVTNEVGEAVDGLTTSFEEIGADAIADNFLNLSFALQESEDKATDLAAVAQFLGVEIDELDTVTQNVVQRFEHFSELLASSMPGVGDAVQNSMGRAEEALESAAEAAEKAGRDFETSGLSLLEIAEATDDFSLESVRDEFQNTLDDLTAFGDNIKILIDNDFDELAQIAAEFGPEWAAFFAEGIASGDEDILREIEEITGKIKEEQERQQAELSEQYALMGEVIGESVSEAITESLSDLAAQIAEELANAESEIENTDWSGAAEGVGESAKSPIERALKQTSDFVGGIFRNEMPNEILSGYDVVAGASENVGEGGKSGTNRGFDGIIPDVSGIFSDVVSAISGTVGSANSAGEGVGSGAKSGTSSGLSGIVPDISGIFNSVVSAIRGTSGSASSAGTEVGSSAGAGTASGLSGQQPTVVGAMNSIIGAVRGTASASTIGIPTQIDQPSNTIGGIISGIISQIRTIVIPTRLGAPSGGSAPPQTRAADGGIFNRPTHVLIGEAFQSEVVIPLERRQRAQQLAEMSGLFDVVSDPNQNDQTIILATQVINIDPELNANLNAMLDRESITTAERIGEEFIRQIVLGMQENVEFLNESISEILFNLIDLLLEIATSDSVRNIGISITEGISQGIDEGTNNVHAAMRELVESTLQIARDAALISSPSQVFARDVGMPIGEGVAAGIISSIPLVREAMRELLDQIRDESIRSDLDELIRDAIRTDANRDSDLFRIDGMSRGDFTNQEWRVLLSGDRAAYERMLRNNYRHLRDDVLESYVAERLESDFDTYYRQLIDRFTREVTRSSQVALEPITNLGLASASQESRERSIVDSVIRGMTASRVSSEEEPRPTVVNNNTFHITTPSEDPELIAEQVMNRLAALGA